jgi:hypothetical protein
MDALGRPDDAGGGDRGLRVLVLFSAAAGGGTAVFFAFWQTARIIDRCPLSLDCVPGPGVGVLLVAGGVALYQVARLARGVSGL